MYTHPNQMEPLKPTGEGTGELRDLAVDVYRRSGELAGRLHPIVRETVVELLRIINSYYSNLIEGHSTHPIDIERAMRQNLSRDPARRALQIESRIHIELQRQIETALRENPALNIAAPEFIRWLHREFYARLPGELTHVEDRATGERHVVMPGEVRTREVEVGEHVAPHHGALPAFLDRFGAFYAPDRFHGDDRLIVLAASHHRLMWIHPFLDGNGRVTRLFSDAYFRRIDVSGYGLWTVSRGLARRRDAYMGALTWGDAPRQGPLDGRGNLSNEGLIHFCRFFLTTCVDQIEYMGGLLRLDGLLDRIKAYVDMRHAGLLPSPLPEGGKLHRAAARMLQEALLRGEVSRGEAPRVMGLPERTARDVLKQLITEGLLVSDTPKGPVRLAIPTAVASHWFPDLFPGRTIEVEAEEGMRVGARTDA